MLWKTAEAPPPRGPLSYDALLHLRKSTSTKTPLCPAVDHTVDAGKELSAPAGGPSLGPDRPRPQAAAAKAPPPVAPRPKITPTRASLGPEEEAPADPLQQAVNPEVVRLEALEKLGLLKEPEAEGDTLGPLPPPKSHSFLHPKPCRSARAPCRSSAPASSPASAQRPPVPANKPPWSSSELQRTQNGGSRPETQPLAPPRPENGSDAVAYTLVVVPGMGADRKEALRKLGLLKRTG